MRVIGGTFGGRRLRAVEGHSTRPTTDRVREALFSRIESRYGLAGASVLDVFAGTGALTIEAMSRGASRGVCIELDRRALETLRGNLREFQLSPRVRVMGDDYSKVLHKLAGEEARARFDRASVDGASVDGASVDRAEVLHSGVAAATAGSIRTTHRRFDGVFLDPPYGKGMAMQALGALAHLGLVRAGGWVTVEIGRREEALETADGESGRLDLVRVDNYGDTRLALYEALAQETPSEMVGEKVGDGLSAVPEVDR